MSTPNAISQKDQHLSPSLRGRAVIAPPVDIFENDDGFLIVADLPGVAADKVDIRLENGELTIQGTWSLPEPEGTAMASEYRAADYKRSFYVPDTIDVDGIEAHLAQGVLSVRLPRSEAVKPRSIAVRAG
ncbi:MAG: Hsp20/alpha crystallin family protein [Pseudomonadota bacterium]